MSGKTASTPGRSGPAEGDAEVDGEPVPVAARAVAVKGEVHADLADAAERHERRVRRRATGSLARRRGCAEMHLAGGDRRRRTVRRADQQPAGVVDRLEAAARRPHRPLARPRPRRSRRRGRARGGGWRQSPCPSSQIRSMPTQASASAEKSCRGVDGEAAVFGERRRGIRQTLRCIDDVDADADDQREASDQASASASSRMPAILAPSSSTSFGHLRRRRSAGPSMPSRAIVHGERRRHRADSFVERKAGDEAKGGGDRRLIVDDEQQARSEIAGRRRPGAAAAAAAGGLLGGRPTRAGRDRRPSPEPSPRCWSSRWRETRPAGSRCRVRSAPSQIHRVRRRSCAARSAATPIWPAMKTKSRMKAPLTPRTTRSSGGIGSKLPTGSSKYMILTMRR